jgi:WD40 repeat protein
MPLHLPADFVHQFEDKSPFGSAGTAVAMAFAANSRLLALGGPRPAIELWDAYEARQVGALSGHEPSKLKGTVVSLVFSPDGQLLASGGQDETVRLWRSSDGECVNVLSGFSGSVNRLAFHPAARVLAAADDDAVRLFDLASGATTPVPLPEGGINGLAFSPDGSLLAVAPGGKAQRGAHSVALVDPASGHTVRTIGGDEFPARSLAFSPDGRRLAVVPKSGADVRLWNTSTWEIARTLKVPSVYTAYQVAFSSQGALGAAIGERVCLWDPSSEAKPVTVKVPSLRTAHVETLAFSPDGQLLATCRRGSSVRIYR